MISRTARCSAHPAMILHRPLGTDAGHLVQTLRLLLDHVEHSLAESLHQSPRIDRADAADHP